MAAGLDVSRTLGWFTGIYPVALQLPPEDALGAAIRSVKERLREVPGRGIGYGALRYLNPDAAIRRRLARPESDEVLFNYLGSAEQTPPRGGAFTGLHPLALSRHPSTPRRYALEVNAMVVAGRLTLEWSFNGQRLPRSAVQGHAQRFLTTLRSLIDDCLRNGAGEPSASDFPLANLDRNKLDKLGAVLRGKRGDS